MLPFSSVTVIAARQIVAHDVNNRKHQITELCNLYNSRGYQRQQTETAEITRRHQNLLENWEEHTPWTVREVLKKNMYFIHLSNWLGSSKVDKGEGGLGSADVDNKPIQDGGEAKAPLWLNRLSGTN